MKGKIVLITGASSGIGKETAKGLAKMGATIIMACRNLEKSIEAQREVKSVCQNDNVDLMELDLSSTKSIRRFASNFTKKYNQLHVLINNAGVFCEVREETEDGYEKTMGVNYFGMFLLTQLLLPVIQQTDKPRIINVTSKAAFQGKLNFEDLNFQRKYHSFKAYSSSKLAVVFFTQELAEQLEKHGVVVNSVHPGGAVATNMWQGKTLIMRIMGTVIKLVATPVEVAAETSVYVASSSEVEGVTGKLFYNKNKIMEYADNCKNPQLQKKLWEYSIEAIR